MKTNQEFFFSFMTPEGTLIHRLSVTMILCPSDSGDIGILAGHTPLVSKVGTGTLQLLRGEKVIFSLPLHVNAQGFLHVQAEHTLLIMDRFCPGCTQPLVAHDSYSPSTRCASCQTCGLEK